MPALYKFSKGGWSVSSEDASVGWYDANEGGKKEAWYLELPGCEIYVSDGAGLQSDAQSLVADLFDADTACVWKLKFVRATEFHRFLSTYAEYVERNAASPKALPRDPPGPSVRTSDTAPGGSVRALAMGAGLNSFVVRRDAVNVMSNSYGHVEATDRSFALPKNFVAPTRVMLAQAETQMNMLSLNKVFQTDVETGSVVRQWACKMKGATVPVKDIANDTRDSQLDHRSTFLGVDANRMCRWDQRTPEGVVQDLALTHVGGRDYSRGTNFTCVATSGEGYIAVGAQNGSVRLFGSSGFKQAVTVVEGLGGPVTAIDVTFDGRYVAATSDGYVLVVKTFDDDSSAFLTRMSGKLSAVVLKLRPEDAVPGERFVKAKFTWVTDSNMTERWLAAGYGQSTIIWNFRHVKAAMSPSSAIVVAGHYSVIPRAEKVVDNAFMHDMHAVAPQAKNALVVATELDVYSHCEQFV